MTWYRDLIDTLLSGLRDSTLDVAVELADAPREIRGYEEVKRQSVERIKDWVERRLAGTEARKAA